MKLNTMALVTCPECQHEVSDLALACPQCAYPYPGKRGVSEEKLQHCSECGGVISKKAQSCPHCGISCADVEVQSPVSQGSKDETWLCTHCGTPYTRKAGKPTTQNAHIDNQESDDPKLPIPEKQEILKPASHIAYAETQQSKEAQHPSVTEEQEMSFLQKMGSAAPSASRQSASRHASPLWFPSSPSQDQGSSSSRPRKKVTLIIGIVTVLLIFLSIVLWFFWEPNGTNPFDGLSIPALSMNNETSAMPQGVP